MLQTDTSDNSTWTASPPAGAYKTNMAAFFQPIRASPTRSGVLIPAVIYGTAEKEDSTTIFSALAAGATGLDTACQPQYYHEEVVGQALARALRPVSAGGLGLLRSDVYIQSKFTTPRGHISTTCPYLPEDPIPVKVKKSVGMTLTKLRLDCLDALLLHGPMPTMAETLEVWQAMEGCVGKETRILGICNVNLAQLRELCSSARIQPSIVQNRFWRETRYDLELRQYCIERGIAYQAFWILKANPELLTSKLLGWLAEGMEISREDALFESVLSLGNEGFGVSILTGTKSPQRLSDTLEAVSRLGVLPPTINQAFAEELERLSISESRQELGG